MQLIPDVMQEASMSETDIMKMESSDVDNDTIEGSKVNDVEPLPKDGVHSCSAKDVMVVIDDSCLNNEINPELKTMSVLKKELLEILNNGENETNINENSSPNQDSENISKVKIESNDSEKTSDIVLKDQTDNSITLNGIVKLEPVDDTDMPDALVDTPNVNGKTQDAISKNNETNVEVANGIVQPMHVKEEINPPVFPLPVIINTIKSEPEANFVLPLQILIDTVKPESPNSVVEASDKPESNLNEKADSETPDKITTESHSTETDATNIMKTPSDTNLDTQKEDLAAEKSSDFEIIKPIDTIKKESSKDTENSCVVEKPITPTLNENSNSSVAISEKCDTLDVIENSTAIIDTLNLDSDDEMNGKGKDKEKTPPPSMAEPKECVSVNLDDEDDDDDIMLVDDDPKEAAPAATDKPKEIVKTKQDPTTLSQNNESPTPSSSDEKVQSKEKDLNIEDDDIVLVNEAKTVAVTISTKEIKVDADNDTKPISENILNTESSIPTPEKKQHKSVIDDLLKSPKPDITTDGKKVEDELPTLPLDFKISFKNNIGELSRDDLEEFCLVKIVEAIVARSNLSDVRLKLKMLQKNIEEWRKKVNDLTKQNKDLDTVVKAVSDLQKRNNEERPVPIKITRSVGLQVGFTCHPSLKPPETPVKPPAVATAKKTKQPKTQSSKILTPNFSITHSNKQSSNNQTPQKKNNTVPVPRLVLATKSPVKTNEKTPSPANSSPVTPTPASNMNLLKTALNNPNSDTRKPSAEKRPAVQSIDLTDDEPPAKQQDVRSYQTKVANGPGRPPNRGNVTKLLQPVNRVSFIGNTTLMPANRPMYIPINANNAQQQNNISPNTTIIGPRKISTPMNRQHTLIRLPGNNLPMRLGHSLSMMAPPVSMCHPAPLPQAPAIKQQSLASWKWIPPRPRLTISKTENGIVISWEMDGYLDSKHEEVASYQIYAYQETATPPNTDLWKKIGDVKSLPLPMACTLTKFMAGFKYYFAVRAVDVRSRVGPFSAPGQILLVNDK